jgi:hypothetical protein
MYLKMRFVTTAPQDMPFELEEMCQALSESIAKEKIIFLSKIRMPAKPSQGRMHRVVLRLHQVYR